MAHYACKNAEMNQQLPTDSTFVLIINSFMASWRVHLTWLDCNQGRKKQALPAELCQAFEVSNVSQDLDFFSMIFATILYLHWQIKQ